MTFLMLFFQELGRPGRDRRPPRHARPKGRATQTERAPFPPVPWVSDETARALRIVIDQRDSDAGYALSPLNRQVMATRFRVDYSAAIGRPIV